VATATGLLMAAQGLCRGNCAFCALTRVQGSARLFSMLVLLLLLLLLPLQLKWLLWAWPACIGSPAPLEGVILGSCDAQGRFKLLLLPLLRPVLLPFWQHVTVSAARLS